MEGLPESLRLKPDAVGETLQVAFALPVLDVYAVAVESAVRLIYAVYDGNTVILSAHD